MGATIYLAIKRHSEDHKARAKAECNELTTFVKHAAAKGEHEVAVVLGATATSINIDVLRDFAGAVNIAEGLPEGHKLTDKRMIAHREHAFGNALRCAGDFGSAELAYQHALEAWPTSHAHERAESTGMLGVCVARQDRLAEAFRCYMSASTLFTFGSSSNIQSAAQCCLEAANVATRAGLNGKALRALVRAYTLLDASHRASAEWVSLAQIAARFADLVTLGSSSYEAPFPGFTIGLRLPADAKPMDPSATTLMLARAAKLRSPRTGQTFTSTRFGARPEILICVR